ncbi:hypothetical protein TNIN_124541 [Trichonephila inaurata madagascariensis]|uniref:Uncharacterized protein n=1 Tax=Trichonephila inaurata madagascariensis TaxID=2747483 RepID=A0A8X6YAX3_9ARAC|nr:hypothetical protein TNIN_124541 [Trichonephila inaurata madagascariensis]
MICTPCISSKRSEQQFWRTGHQELLHGRVDILLGHCSGKERSCDALSMMPVITQSEELKDSSNVGLGDDWFIIRRIGTQGSVADRKMSIFGLFVFGKEIG